jgi:hypothetical protein
VRVNNGNFARVKPEGAPSAKHTYDIRFFYCEQCESKWETTSESQRDYYDYLALRDRTTTMAHDMGKDGSYGPPQYLDGGDLILRAELAKKIASSYKHLLDLNPVEWHEIEEDSQTG